MDIITKKKVVVILFVIMIGVWFLWIVIGMLMYYAAKLLRNRRDEYL